MSESKTKHYINYRFLQEHRNSDYVTDDFIVAGYPELSQFKTMGDYRRSLRMEKTYSADEMVGWNN